MSRKYTKIDQYEKQILSILIVRAKPEQKVYLQRLRKIFLQLFTFAHPVVSPAVPSGLCSRGSAHRALPACRGTLRTCWGLWAARSDSSSSLYRERSPSFDSSRRSSAGNLPGGKRGSGYRPSWRSELFSSVNPPLVDSGSSARKQKSAFLFLFRENSEWTRYVWRKVFYTVSGRNVENRFTQIILYLHGFTGKQLPILAESRETEFKRCFMGLH